MIPKWPPQVHRDRSSNPQTKWYLAGWYRKGQKFEWLYLANHVTSGPNILYNNMRGTTKQIWVVMGKMCSTMFRATDQHIFCSWIILCYTLTCEIIKTAFFAGMVINFWSRYKCIIEAGTSTSLLWKKELFVSFHTHMHAHIHDCRSIIIINYAVYCLRFATVINLFPRGRFFSLIFTITIYWQMSIIIIVQMYFMGLFFHFGGAEAFSCPKTYGKQMSLVGATFFFP